jgi:hypothetical protein
LGEDVIVPAEFSLAWLVAQMPHVISKTISRKQNCARSAAVLNSLCAEPKSSGSRIGKLKRTQFENDGK